MRVGIDFDNTIVSYDALFHKVALEQGVIPTDVPRNKLAVRDYLRRERREDIWTEMQGYVYGARMEEAEAYPGVLNFLRWASDCGIAVSIISHKTRYPFIGPNYDLHEAARRWLKSRLVDGEDGYLVAPDRIFFELTKEEKIRRIETVGCDYYIDDLPEVLLAETFPRGTACILFDPDAHHDDAPGLVRVRSWDETLSDFQRKCRTVR